MRHEHKTHRRRKILRVVLIILVLLIVVRLALPSVVLYFANRTLAGLKGYYGHIDDIDLAIIRGAYAIDSIYLNKVDTVSQKQTPLFSASRIDLSVEWRALLKGSIAGEVMIEKPAIRFTKEKVEPKQLQEDSTTFKDLADKFMPLKINRLTINNGSPQYIDDQSKPKVDVTMEQLHVTALNLSNSYDSANVLPSTIHANAKVYEGTLVVDARLDPLADDPTFDLNAELKNTNLVKLNDFFQAYAKIDVNKGSFGLYTEVAAKEGNFTGYVKPLVRDLDVIGKEDRKDNILRKLWEGLAGAISEVLENQPRDQFATKVPFEGSFQQTDTNLWFAIAQILRNAFIQALQPSIDNQINIANVPSQTQKEEKGLLKRIFGKDEDKKKDDKSKEGKNDEKKDDQKKKNGDKDKSKN